MHNPALSGFLSLRDPKVGQPPRGKICGPLRGIASICKGFFVVAGVALVVELALWVPRAVGPTSVTYAQPACRGGAAGWDPQEPGSCHPLPPPGSVVFYR